MTVSRLRDVPGIGVDRMGDAADTAGDPGLLRLENLERGKLAGTPMVDRGSEAAGSYVRFVYANEPCERLAGLGGRVRTALA